MNPSASEPREVLLPPDPPSAPAAIRYPLALVRYPFWRLVGGAPKPARNSERIPLVQARLRKMKRGAHTLVWWLPLWYLLGQMALFLWIDQKWEFERTRVEHEKWQQLHERLAEAPDQPLVLMLGSSRSDWAFQAGRLNGQPGPDGRPLLTYNLAVPTTGPLHEALYLNDLLREGIRPRLLLIEFVATHLNQSQRGLMSEEHFTLPQWLTCHQILFMRPYFSNKRRMLLSWLESRVAPWYAFRSAVHDHLQGKHSLARPFDQQEQPTDDWGWRMIYDDPNTPIFRAARWAWGEKMYGESLKHFRLGAGPVQAMRDVLDRCRREHLPVALVKMPVSKEFRALYPAEAQADLDKLFAELSQGVLVIDATDWLEKDDFDDGHHVRRVGAYRYTTRMIDEVQKILALTEPSGEQKATP